MFQAEVDSGPSFSAFLLQQLGVWVMGAVWGMVCAGSLAQLNGLGEIGRVLESASNIALALGPPLLLGRLARLKLPDLACSGRFVWLLPGALMTAAILTSAFASRLGTDLGDLLFPSSEGWSPIVAMLFLYPTLGCIGYSLGVAPPQPEKPKERQP